MKIEITSLQHPRVKEAIRLRDDAAYRKERGRALVSGAKLVADIASTGRVSTLFTCEAEDYPPARETLFVTREVLKKITGLGHPARFAAEVELPQRVSLENAQRLLILDGISDPGNVGTLLRTAWALGWEGVFLTQGSVDPWNDKAVRAAQGATFFLPWHRGTDEELDALLTTRSLYVAAMQGTPFRSLSYSPPMALALGHETRGVSARLQAQGTPVHIPQVPGADSLNVASAGAILLHHIGLT